MSEPDWQFIGQRPVLAKMKTLGMIGGVGPESTIDYYGSIIADGTPDSLREIPEVSPEGTRRFEIATHDVTSALRKARTRASAW